MIPRNVIFPAWTLPYASTVFLWPVALGVFLLEGRIHSRREDLPLSRAMGWALLANVLSSITGVHLGSALESHSSWFRRHLGYHHDLRAICLAWSYAFALSVAIELPFLRTHRQGSGWGHRIVTVLLANLASYAILGTAVLIFESFGRS